MADTQKLYICDPKKNEKCSKQGCKDRDRYCALTERPECAVKDDEGKPILYMELDPEDGRVIYQSEERLDLWANLVRETG